MIEFRYDFFLQKKEEYANYLWHQFLHISGGMLSARNTFPGPDQRQQIKYSMKSCAAATDTFLMNDLYRGQFSEALLLSLQRGNSKQSLFMYLSPLQYSVFKK